MFEPTEYALANGLQVIYRPLERLVQAWSRDQRTLLISTRVPEYRRPGVITHLLGHAVLGHASCRDPLAAGRDDSEEVRADRWAVRHLIDPRDTNPSTDDDTIARRFGVTLTQVRVFRRNFMETYDVRPPRRSSTDTAALRSVPTPVGIP